jgi:hypothetical protein
MVARECRLALFDVGHAISPEQVAKMGMSD